jgi:hypothetical protein
LAGRFAGVGYSAVRIGVTFGRLAVMEAATLTMRLANPCHVVTPSAVK